MAATDREDSPASPQPVQAPAVIQHAPLAAKEGMRRKLLRVLPAWVISSGMHAIFLSLFLFVSLNPGTAHDDRELAMDSNLDEVTKVVNLTEDQPGLDPTKVAGLDSDRTGRDNIPELPDPFEQGGFRNPSFPMEVTLFPPPIGGSNRLAEGSNALAPGGPGSTGPGIGPGLSNSRGDLSRRKGSGETRLRTALQDGGNAESEAAVARGLKWIALHQANDGHWSLNGFHSHAHDKIGLGGQTRPCNCEGRAAINNDIAGTALGLLPFLGAGETHKAPPLAQGIHYTKHVEQGLKYLLARQATDGDFGGGMYAHGLATIAVCEAYGLTSDPHLRVPAQKALDFIVKAQHAGGGWRYAPGQPGDTSVVGWQVMALKSGQMAGLSVPNPTFKGAEKWLDACMSTDGGYGYTSPQDTPTMTAVGLLCREYLGWTPRNVNLINGVTKLKKTPPGSLDSIYYYYYATQVLHHMGGEGWEAWNPKMRDQLIAAQDKGADPKKPHQFGSWSPARDAHGGPGGRLMVTSLSVLTLEVYYRHLPLYRRDLGAVKDGMAGK